jgi:hypothetical protein
MEAWLLSSLFRAAVQAAEDRSMGFQNSDVGCFRLLLAPLRKLRDFSIHKVFQMDEEDLYLVGLVFGAMVTF